MPRHSPDAAAPRRSTELPGRGVPLVSVVVPVYRNRATLMELCERVSGAFAAAQTPWELILVIDACPERSEELLPECSQRYPAVRGLYLPTNQGQNRAVLWGLTRTRGHLVAVMDADLQDPPEALPRLIEALDQTGAELVFARRGSGWTSVGRHWTSRWFKRILSARSGGRLPIDAGLFLACDRRVVDFLLDSPFAQPYLMSRLARFRGRVAAVSVTRSARLQGTSAYSSGMRLRLALRGLVQLLVPSSGLGRRQMSQPWRGRLAPIDHYSFEADHLDRSHPPSSVGPDHAFYSLRS